MALLVSVVLGDVVEVVTTDDEGTVHLGRDDLSGQDTSTDGDESSEGALLVCRAEIELAKRSVSNVSVLPSPNVHLSISQLSSIHISSTKTRAPPISHFDNLRFSIFGELSFQVPSSSFPPLAARPFPPSLPEKNSRTSRDKPM